MNPNIIHSNPSLLGVTQSKSVPMKGIPAAHLSNASKSVPSPNGMMLDKIEKIIPKGIDKKIVVTILVSIVEKIEGCIAL